MTKEKFTFRVVEVILLVAMAVTFISAYSMTTRPAWEVQQTTDTTTIYIVPPAYPDTILDTLALNKDNFHYVCNQLNIEHPEIVYAQARLESGNFTSSVFKQKNNMLGLYDSYNKTYYSFVHWVDCLRGYKNKVQYKYTGGDYIKFLEELPYAADKSYTRKIRMLVEQR